jgi:hypothetical protein
MKYHLFLRINNAKILNEGTLMEECSICLHGIKHTRRNKKIDCGHAFHPCCINKWKKSGGVTCPVCRRTLPGVSNYSITFTIHNRSLNMSETSEFTTETLEAFIHAFGLDREITRTVLTEVDIDIDDVDNLRTLLNELHVPLLNINPAIFNAE